MPDNEKMLPRKPTTAIEQWNELYFDIFWKNVAAQR